MASSGSAVLVLKVVEERAGEIAQQMRPLIALVENPGWVPSIYTVAYTNLVNYSFKESDVFV